MTPDARSHCPSCRHRLSPFAMECPVCGLGLTPAVDLQRPLLFQASAIRHAGEPEARTQAISTPALGRVVPLDITPAEPLPPPAAEPLPLPEREVPPLPGPDPASTSFWPLARVEMGEALCIAAINGLFFLLTGWLSGTPRMLFYAELWPYLLPLHVALSWGFVMVPMALTGQSPLMVPQGLFLAALAPEQRMAFSLFHLISVACFPISFLCMLLTPGHRTLAELLTGQEILARPKARMR